MVCRHTRSTVVLTNERHNKHWLSDSVCCEQCERQDTFVHRLAQCGEGTAIQEWTRKWLAWIIRTDPRCIPTEWIICSQFWAWPPQRQGAVQWTLANLILYKMQKRILKVHIFKNILLSTRRPRGKIPNFFRKLKLNCTCTTSTSLPPPMKQGESETTLGTDLPSTRIIRSTIPFRKSLKSCSPMSDLVTCYGLQSTRFTCLVLVPFEHEHSKSECRQTKQKNYEK